VPSGPMQAPTGRGLGLGLGLVLVLVVAAALAAGRSGTGGRTTSAAGAAGAAAAPACVLVGRAVLPALTFAEGPTSGSFLGTAPIRGVTPPFPGKQPVQGFSALVASGDGTYLALADNGFGDVETSADFELRVYTIRPDFRTAQGGAGAIAVLGSVALRDPSGRVPFAIVNGFTAERVLTGADLDPESLARAPDGTLWIGDEVGPFLLHFDAGGTLLEAPIALPDLDRPGLDVRSPQSPLAEEGAALRVLQAVRARGRRLGARADPVCSPWHLLLADGDPRTHVPHREAPPEGSGLAPASSEIFDVGSLRRAGFPVVVWTVNDEARMRDLVGLGVDGIITDRPDRLLTVLRDLEARLAPGAPGFFLGDGRIDRARLDVQGHRGARDLRPENTLPAIEAALDHLVTTVEVDCGVTSDGVPVLGHDPEVSSRTTRRADGAPYGPADEVAIRDLALADLQARFVADRLARGASQENDLALSPVSVAFAEATGLPHPYAIPSLAEVLAFVDAYARHHETGPGRAHPFARIRAANARAVRFNVETKTDPRREGEGAGATPPLDAASFARAVAEAIRGAGLEERADIQSFDFRTLLEVQSSHPRIRTVCLFGDFPVVAGAPPGVSGDGANLQPVGGRPSPWLAGLPWPYRATARAHPPRARTSGGFEGLAISPDGARLYPLLEKPLAGDDPGALLIHEIDIASRRSTGARWRYPLEPGATAIGDLVLVGERRGLVVERDDSEGDLGGLKRLYVIELGPPGSTASKRLVADLLRIDDPALLSLPGLPGDVGLGRRFALPFWTIEGLVVAGPDEVLVLTDNNFPFSCGRHVGAGAPDDTEIVRLRLASPPDGR